MDRRSTRRAAGAELTPYGGHREVARALDRARRTAADDIDIVLQPDHWTGADLLSRVAVGSRPFRSKASRRHSDCLRDPRAGRTGGCSEDRGHVMTADLGLDFAPIAERIRESIATQGFMSHVGAELCELTRGSCTLAVDRRPELLHPHGLVPGGSTTFLRHNATTIAAGPCRPPPG